MAYTLGNKCAKNCCKRTIQVQLIVDSHMFLFQQSVHPELQDL